MGHRLNLINEQQEERIIVLEEWLILTHYVKWLFIALISITSVDKNKQQIVVKKFQDPIRSAPPSQ